MHPRLRLRPLWLSILLALAAAPALPQVPQNPSGPFLSLPAAVRQGEALLAVLVSSHPLSGAEGLLIAPSGKIMDRALAFELPSAAPGKRYGILFAFGRDDKPGAWRVAVDGAWLTDSSGDSGPSGLFHVDGSLTLEARSWFSETISLDQANTDLRTKPDPRKTAEAEALWVLLNRTDTAAIHDPAAYRFPVDPKARHSANFGDRRVYAYPKGGSDTSEHAGLDLAVVVDTPVLACSAGKVAFSGPRIVTGYTVIVEHLPGLYSLYMHLSRLEVSVGQLVQAGTELGRSGSTGLSTGPHLHFELRLRGKAVDPEAWLRKGPQ